MTRSPATAALVQGGVKINQLNGMILDRDRHRPLVEEIREAGARTKFIMDGDVAGAIAAALPVPASTPSWESAERRRAS